MLYPQELLWPLLRVPQSLQTPPQVLPLPKLQDPCYEDSGDVELGLTPLLLLPAPLYQRGSSQALVLKVQPHTLFPSSFEAEAQVRIEIARRVFLVDCSSAAPALDSDSRASSILLASLSAS